MKEVNPKETTRAYAFEMWMNAPMPMLTFFKTVDVTRLVRISKRTRCNPPCPHQQTDGVKV